MYAPTSGHLRMRARPGSAEHTVRHPYIAACAGRAAADAFRGPRWFNRSVKAKNAPAATCVGDWLETRGIHGEPARRGRIDEILGEPGHEHYKVHWDEQHESIVYPADGVRIIHKKRR